MMRPYIGSWKRLAVQGAAAVLFGLATLVWPHVTLWALVVLWGAFAFVDGVTALSAAIADQLLVHRGWVAFWGVTGIAAGVVTFAVAVHHGAGTARRDRDLGAAHRRLADRLRHHRTQAGAGGVVDRARRCPAGAPGRAPRRQPRCRGDRHHLGDRLVRLPVRHSSSCGSRPSSATRPTS